MPATAISPPFSDSLSKAAQGSKLNREELLRTAQEAPLEALLQCAKSICQRRKGQVVSFSKKVFIPLTRLCRDYCGYCTFRRDPSGEQDYMTPEQVLEVAEAGRRAGCKEALFSLGDQPERIFPQARAFLHRLGYQRTLDYLGAMMRLVLEETGLLPHPNPGVMSREDMATLRECSASMGLMLESTSLSLFRPGGAHARAPDKIPARRLETLRQAGELRVPFTTGILVGIGESLQDRVDSFLAIREIQQTYGHIQEVIVQNFRAKPGIPMAATPEPDLDEFLRTVALSRLALGGETNVQAPPNLSYADFPRLLDAGINDWGGISPVTPDHINPEAPWPEVAKLREASQARGCVLRERLAVYPEFLARPEFVDVNMRGRIAVLADAQGYAANGSS